VVSRLSNHKYKAMPPSRLAPQHQRKVNQVALELNLNQVRFRLEAVTNPPLLNLSLLAGNSSKLRHPTPHLALLHLLVNQDSNSNNPGSHLEIINSNRVNSKPISEVDSSLVNHSKLRLLTPRARSPLQISKTPIHLHLFLQYNSPVVSDLVKIKQVLLFPDNNRLNNLANLKILDNRANRARAVWE